MGQFNDLDIVRIIELHSFTEANTYLEQGWKLLSVRAEAIAEHQQQNVYVLGLPRSIQLSTLNKDQLVEQRNTVYERTPPPPKSRRNNPSPTTSRTPASPITLVSRIPLTEASTKRRRKTNDTPVPQREPTEEELRERAAWKEVQETGKPVLLGDKLLMPEGMSAWDAMQFLPGDMREQTQAASQHTVSKAFMAAVDRMRERLKTAEVNAEYEKFSAFPYAAQMAIAENIVRQQFGWPEADIRELLVQYGARLESDQNTSDK